MLNRHRHRGFQRVIGKQVKGFGPSRGRGLYFTPTHTQGAGVPFAVRPSKARWSDAQRIDNPSRLASALQAVRNQWLARARNRCA